MREAAAPGFGLFLLPADGPVGASRAGGETLKTHERVAAPVQRRPW